MLEIREVIVLECYMLFRYSCLLAFFWSAQLASAQNSAPVSRPVAPLKKPAAPKNTQAKPPLPAPKNVKIQTPPQEVAAVETQVRPTAPITLSDENLTQIFLMQGDNSVYVEGGYETNSSKTVLNTPADANTGASKVTLSSTKSGFTGSLGSVFSVAKNFRLGISASGDFLEDTDKSSFEPASGDAGPDQKSKISNINVVGVAGFAITDQISVAAAAEYQSETTTVSGQSPAKLSVVVPAVGLGYHGEFLDADLGIKFAANQKTEINTETESNGVKIVSTTTEQIDRPMELTLTNRFLITPEFQAGFKVNYLDLKKQEEDVVSPVISQKLKYGLLAGFKFSESATLQSELQFASTKNTVSEGTVVGFQTGFIFDAGFGQVIPRVRFESAFGKFKSDPSGASVDLSGTGLNFAVAYKKLF